MKSFKAFVSSTYVDLKRHRAQVIQTLRQAGFMVDPMEDWTASTQAPRQFSQARLQGCDLCILLLARRRGHVPRGEQRSITQLEVDAAAAQGIPVLVFMLDDAAPWPARHDERARDPRLRQWLADWAEAKGVQRFGADPASVPIAPALTRWIAENSLGSRDAAQAELARYITAEVLNLVLAVQMAERRAMPDQKTYDDAYFRWEQAAARIGHQLQAQRASDELQTAWLRIAGATGGLYRLSGTWSQPWRGQLIEELQQTFGHDATDWPQLADHGSRQPGNEAFQRYFAAWWALRERLLAGCAEFGRRLLAG